MANVNWTALIIFLALFALKPLVTALCLGGGASGGLFTPFMSTGAVFGGFAGHLWLLVWPGAPVGAFALVGASAMLASSIQAPLAGLVLVVELTHSGLDLMIPIMIAVFLATLVARRIDGYSIYSARLPGHTPGRLTPPGESAPARPPGRSGAGPARPDSAPPSPP